MSSEALQTYRVSVGPPSIALAMMAYLLAWHRKALEPVPPPHYRPAERREARTLHLSVSMEHYRILDRITRGEQP